MAEDREPTLRPIGEVLPDMRLALPDGCVVETAFVLTKIRFEDGTSAWSWRSPGIFNQEELLGALIMQTEALKLSMLDDWE